MKKHLLLLAGLVLPLSLVAQVKMYRVTPEQRVDDGVLIIDFYIERTGAADFSLSSSNFSVFLTKEHLDLSRASIDHSADGKWDNGVDPAGYFDLSLGYKDNFVVLNVNAKSELESQNPGNGQLVTASKQQIGRIRVPITNHWGTNTLTWRLNVMEVLKWSDTPIKADGEFVTPAPNFPLCDVPGRPTLTGPTDTTFCSNSELMLQSDWGGLNLWYRNGVFQDSVTGEAYRVLIPGSYQVKAQNYNCTSELSEAVSNINVIEVPEPAISQQARVLICNLTEQVQWYKDGVAIPGATASTYMYNTSGVYSVRVPSECGPINSNELTIDLEGKPVVEIDDSDGKEPLVAYPNPYPYFTYIAYEVKKEGKVEINVYTQGGILVGRIVNESQKPGRYRIRFSAQSFGYPTGSYSVKLSVGDQQETIKIIEGT